MESPDTCQEVRIATQEHTRAINDIYRLVQIKPEIFLKIAHLAEQNPASPRFVKPLGGFISPVDDRDMDLCIHNGLILVCVQNGEVLGYNRVVTQADTVHQELCAEFVIDPSLREFGYDSFNDWSGNRKRQATKTLRHIHWIDRKQALIIFNASLAGLNNKNTGRLAWSVDAAVHPESQKQGIAKSLIERINKELKPEFKFRVFRIFEILNINGTEVNVANVPSKAAFSDPSWTQFAYTEEDVIIDSRIKLRVRWNHWLRYF